jgi:hypothetical protein
MNVSCVITLASGRVDLIDVATFTHAMALALLNRRPPQKLRRVPLP